MFAYVIKCLAWIHLGLIAALPFIDFIEDFSFTHRRGNA